MHEGDQNFGQQEKPYISDSFLISASKEDPEQFGEIVGRYQERVSRFFSNRVLNVEEAKDLAQATWLRALVGLQNYQDQGAPFGAWLFTIAHNTWANWVRSTQAYPTVDFSTAEGKSEETYNLVKIDGNWKVEYVKSGMDNAKEGLDEGMEKLEDAVDTLKQALDTLSVE